MTSIDAETQRRLVELRGLAKAWHRTKADALFRRIVADSSRENLALISHDLSDVLEDFEKKRKKELGTLLQQALSEPDPKDAEQENVATARSLAEVKFSYAVRLADLRDKHIFQWTSHYRDQIGFVFKDVAKFIESTDEFDTEEAIQEVLAAHSEEIFRRGYVHVLERGLDHEIGVTKSIRGLQQFLYVIFGIFRDQKELAITKKNAATYWDVSSAMLCGILVGYSRVDFGTVNGGALLNENFAAWLPLFGFCRGRHSLRLSELAPRALAGSDAAICSLLLGVDRWTAQVNTPAVLPRYCRLNLGPDRLDITYGIGIDRVSRDIVASAFLKPDAIDSRDIKDAVALRAVVVAELDEASRDWVESNCQHEVVNARDAQGSATQFETLAGTVAAALTLQATPAATEPLAGRIPRNYAKDFPLDDPLFRKGQFEVERHSVRNVLQELQRGNGAFVWCSVRRSGKTTAAETLSGTSDQMTVVMQTMDHRTNALEFNVLSSRVRLALEDGRAIPETFFGDLAKDCIAATAQSSGTPKKILFIIDEYESLFGLIDAYVERNPSLRHTVALPLLSQMLGFSMKNVLLFLGQRPDAHMILLAQNQLSPNVRQHAFPLFEHQPGASSEFPMLLKRVLTDKLRFSSDFASAVFKETKGHPYLTVNVLVDLCDWLIQSREFSFGEELTNQHFADFVKERLEISTLKGSPYYGLFHSLFVQFLSERSRTEEPWLYSVTSIIREIAKRHPKRLCCSLAAFEELAKQYEDLVHMPARRLLNSAAMANFLQESQGFVHVGIPLMARLAASATSRPAA